MAVRLGALHSDRDAVRLAGDVVDPAGAGALVPFLPVRLLERDALAAFAAGDGLGRP